MSIDYEKYKPQFEMFLQVIIQFVIGRIKERESVASILDTTENYLTNNILTICEKTGINIEDLKKEIQKDKNKLSNYLVNLLSPTFKMIINMYNTALLPKIESTLSKVWDKII